MFLVEIPQVYFAFIYFCNSVDSMHLNMINFRIPKYVQVATLMSLGGLIFGYGFTPDVVRNRSLML